MVAAGQAIVGSQGGHRAQKDIMPPSTTDSLPTMGTFCIWLQTQDHSCPASPYWKQRRAEMRTLDTAPAEVQHAICALLCPKDIAAVRLTSTVLAKIGAHYLMRRVTFHTSTASLERLLNIASHEVFRQHVEMVHFEANLLANVCCRDCWNTRFVSAKKGPGSSELDKPKPPQAPATVREKRLYARNLRKWEDEIVDSTFQEHHRQRELQQQFHQQHPDLMAEIMHEFPRLQKVTFTLARCHHTLSVSFQDEYLTRLGSCAPLSTDTETTGQQLRHIIAPGHQALQNLQELVIADLDPSFFKAVEGYSVACQAFTNLKKLDISFRLPDMMGQARTGAAWMGAAWAGNSIAYKNFQNGDVQRAIASAKGLEELRITFNDNVDDGPCVELKTIFGDTSFLCLKKLSIGFVEADPKSFMDILKRQKELKHFSVNCVCIRGSWLDVLEKMRDDLDLKEADFDGFLADDEQLYSMDNADVDFYMDCHEEFPIGSAIEIYLTDPSMEYPNPLGIYDEAYANPETLNEMWHDMMAELGTDCGCEVCLEDSMDCENDSDHSDESFSDMPDLEDPHPMQSHLHPMPGHCSGTEYVST